MVKNSYNILFLILATPPLQSLEQLIRSTKLANPKSAVIVHLGGYSEPKDVVKKLKDHADVFVLPKQHNTERGYITHAIVASILYANKNINFEYLVLLPFNCLPIKPNLIDFLLKANSDIHLSVPFKSYKHVTLKNGLEHNWKSGRLLWESKISRLLLRKYFNKKFYFGGNFEGIVLHKKVINHLNHFNWKFFFVKKNYSFMFEEIFFHTIFMELAKRHNYKISSDQICFLDWEQSKWVFNKEKKVFEHTVIFGTQERVKVIRAKNENAYFYKWVSTNDQDSHRLELLKAIK